MHMTIETFSMFGGTQGITWNRDEHNTGNKMELRE